MTSTRPPCSVEGEVAHSGRLCDRFDWTLQDYISKIVHDDIQSPGFRLDGAVWHMALRIKMKSGSPESLTLNLWRTPVSGFRYQVKLGLVNKNGKDLGIISCHTDADGFLEVRKFVLWFKNGPVTEDKKFFPGELLTIFCELFPSGKSKEILKTDGSATGLLIQNFKDLLSSGANSDLELKVGNRIFKAHKAILGARSPVFASMFQHDMKENNSGAVDIPDCSADAFEVYLRYLYTGQMEDCDLGQVCNLYYIADKYNALELKGRCVKLLDDSLSVENFCDVVALALRHSESGLLESAIDFFNRNVRVIIQTVQWQKYLSENPIHANELYIKAIEAQLFEKRALQRVP